MKMTLHTHDPNKKSPSLTCLSLGLIYETHMASTLVSQSERQDRIRGPVCPVLCCYCRTVVRATVGSVQSWQFCISLFWVKYKKIGFFGHIYEVLDFPKEVPQIFSAATSSSRSDDVTLLACLLACLSVCLSPYFLAVLKMHQCNVVSAMQLVQRGKCNVVSAMWLVQCDISIFFNILYCYP